MANYCVLGLGLLYLAVISVPRVHSYRLNGEPQILEFGTFIAADKTCFLKKVFRGQKSPVTFSFNNPGNTIVDYVKVESDQTNKKGGISADIIRGAVGTISVSLQVMESSGKSSFSNDAQISMMCA